MAFRRTCSLSGVILFFAACLCALVYTSGVNLTALFQRKQSTHLLPKASPDLEPLALVENRVSVPSVAPVSKPFFPAPDAGAGTVQPRGNVADGCSNVYLDVGANRGVQVRKLFQASKYPMATVKRIFRSTFGNDTYRNLPSSQSALCAFGFEASPVHLERLRTLEKAYTAAGWRVSFLVPKAVSDSDEKTITLNLNAKHGLGASAVYNSTHRTNKGESALVQTLDFARWIDEVIRPRSLGPFPSMVVMKMDIEGSEFDVVPRMLERGQFCAGIIDKVFFEWHEKYIFQGTTKRRELMKHIANGTWCNGRPPSQLFRLDDESYNTDTIPLPRTFVEAHRGDTRKHRR